MNYRDDLKAIETKLRAEIKAGSVDPLLATAIIGLINALLNKYHDHGT